MAVKLDQIGIYNKALVLALKNKDASASGYPISDYRHPQSYNYDLSYGMYGINTKKALPGSYVGIKYYCYNRDNTIDMAKRIVHIYDRLNPGSPETFYRLIHTSARPDLRDNSYSTCDLITDIP
jgi:hypothetical protein